MLRSHEQHDHDSRVSAAGPARPRGRPARSLEELYDDHGASRRRHRARLRALSEQQRAVIALSLYGDRTYPQVADVMALPDLVVRDLLRSGLRRLRADESG